MANYTKTTNFTAKDALASGNANKIIYGSDIDAEFDAIAVAIATKNDAGAWTSPAFDANDFSANGLMTWTLVSGDVLTYAYSQTGNTMTVAFVLATSTVGGTPDSTLYIDIPAGKVATKTILNSMGYVIDAATGVVAARCFVTAGDTKISIIKNDGTDWTAGTNLTYTHGEITFEVD